jgi:hypothetical protein
LPIWMKIWKKKKTHRKIVFPKDIIWSYVMFFWTSFVCNLIICDVFLDFVLCAIWLYVMFFLDFVFVQFDYMWCFFWTSFVCNLIICDFFWTLFVCNWIFECVMILVTIFQQWHFRSIHHFFPLMTHFIKWKCEFQSS